MAPAHGAAGGAPERPPRDGSCFSNFGLAGTFLARSPARAKLERGGGYPQQAAIICIQSVHTFSGNGGRENGFAPCCFGGLFHTRYVREDAARRRLP